MLLAGLLASGVIGACLGLWFVHLVDWVRCRAVGVPDPREARTCPALVGPYAWARMPWGHLAASGPDRRFALLAILFGAVVWTIPWLLFWTRHASLLAWLWNMLFLSGLLFVAILDARWRILPVEPLVVSAILFGCGRIALGASYVSVLMGALALGAFFGLQSWLSRGRWLGGGDPVLAFAIGAAVGWPHAAVAVYATYLAVIPLLVIQFVRFRTWRRVRWPFGPLLAFGAAVSLVQGEAIWRWLVGP